MTETAIDRLRARVSRSGTAQTLVVYLPVCWLVLQVVDVFVDQLGLPKWVFVGTVVLMGVGLASILLASRGLRTLRRWLAAGGSPGPAADGEAAPRPRFSRRRLATAGGVALLAWAVVAGGWMGLRALGVGPAGTLIASGDLDQSDLVLISAFENRTADPGLSQTVADALAVDLSQSKLVRVVDDRSTVAALERMKKPPSTPLTSDIAQELAQREGIAAVLEGEVAALGPATLINVRLVSSSGGEVLAEFSERARAPEDLLDAVDKVSGEIRNKVGESLKVLRAEPPLEQVTTASLPALKLYSRALRKMAEGDDAAATLLLRQALELDPEFAMAWRALGTALGNSDRDRAGAMAAYTNAYLFRARLPERERGLAAGSYFLQVARDPEKAAAAYQAVLDAYPKEIVALNNLALVQSRRQRFADAEPMYVQAAALRPEEITLRYNIVMTQIALGRYADAQATWKLTTERFPGALLAEQMGVILAGAQGQYDVARARAAAITAKRPGDPEARYFSLSLIAPLAAEQGRDAEGIRMGAEMAELNASHGLPGAALHDRLYIARLHQERGRSAEARAALADALRRHPLDAMPADQRPYWSLAETYAFLGLVKDARGALALAEAHGRPVGDNDYGVHDYVLGLIALAEGDHATAIERLKAASETGECTPCVLPDLGRAYEAAGQPQAAIATYERYDALPQFAHEQRGPVYGRLIALHRAAGDAARAAEYERRLERLWKEAHAAPKPRLQLASTG